MKPIFSEQDLRAGYMAALPHIEEWANSIDEVVTHRLAKWLENDVKIYQQCRVKDVDSFVKKALYRGKPYTNPMVEIEDKVGFRLVVLFTDKVNLLAEEFTKIFSDIWQISVAKKLDEHLFKPELFNYQSYHLIVRPHPGTCKVENDLLNLLACEVQIRTLLQHAYAETSHDSVYKGPFSTDVTIKRSLAKSMALMEATDDYFCSIFNMITDKERLTNKFIEMLCKHYERIVPGFDEAQVNVEINDDFLKVFGVDEGLFDKVSKYFEKNQEHLQAIIQQNDLLLFGQPIIIFIGWLANYQLPYLEAHWPYNHSSLEDILLKMNIANGK